MSGTRLRIRFQGLKGQDLGNISISAQEWRPGGALAEVGEAARVNDPHVAGAPERPIFEITVPEGLIGLTVVLPNHLSDAGWSVPTINIRAHGPTSHAFLSPIPRGSIHFQVGNSLRAFSPVTNNVAIGFEHHEPGRDEAGELIRDLTAQTAGLGLSPPREQSQRLAGGAILMFGHSSGVLPQLQAIEQRIATSGFHGRAGMLQQGTVRPLIIDRRFVVTFADGVSDSEQVARLQSFKADMVYRWSERTLVAISRGSIADACRVAADLHRSDDVEFAEMSTMSPLASAERYPQQPEDETQKTGSPSQVAFEVQRIKEAWAEMPPESLERQVRVAVLEKEPVPRGHQDINPSNLRYIDFKNPGAAQPEPSANPKSHGLAVLSVVAASSHQNPPGSVLGVAPDMDCLAGVIPSLEGDYFNQVLRWTAGLGDDLFATIVPENGAGAQEFDLGAPPAPGFEVICLALWKVPLTHARDLALQELAEHGRGGLGTVVVCAAGNKRVPLEVANELATSEHTICVNSCPRSVGGKVSFFEPLPSPDGVEIDVSAQSLQAASFVEEGGNLASGARVFGNSSAATATTAGAVCLLLAAHPSATWRQVRDALRSGADRFKPSIFPVPNEPHTGKQLGYGRLDAAGALRALAEALAAN